MHILQDFVPDFTPKVITGTICNRKSHIQCEEGLCFISMFNKINIWNLKTQELLLSLGSRKHYISTFLVQNNCIYIGYEDGTIEIIKEYLNSSQSSTIHRLHTKKVTKILLADNMLFSGSMDSSICCYDTILEDVKFNFTGNCATVESLFITENGKILAACGDRSVKIWNINCENLEDAITFDDDVVDMVSKGFEALICLRSGESFLIDLNTKERKEFEKFKNIRNMKVKNNNLAIQCQKKTVIFQITKETSLGLVAIKRMPSKADFNNFDFIDNEICFISKENKIICGDKTLDFGFHREDILDIKTDHSKIYSLSKDRLICWNKSVENPLKDGGQAETFDVDEFTKENLELFFSLELFNASCFEFFANLIIVGNHEGLIIIDRKFNEIKEKIKIGKVTSMSASDSYLAVSVGNKVIFYDDLFKEFTSLQAPESIVYSVLLNHCYICSCLDNKIYQFVFPTLELRVTLYGHSLPVRSFSISSDEKLLVSCGADKLVKLWGLEFGECRKSFVGDCKNVQFLNESLFMYCDKDLQYYNYFEKLKKFRIFSPGLICPGTDYLIVSCDRGLVLLSMNKYEHVKEDDSSELENLAIKNIASARDYDSFLDHLQRLEDNFSDSSVSMFFDFLEKIDFNELKQYLYVLDHISISNLLRVILQCKDRNAIVLTRLFSQIFHCHKDTCLGIEIFEEIRVFLLEKTAELRKVYNLNSAHLEMDFYGIDLADE